MCGKKLTIDFVKESFEVEGYILLSTEYIGAHSKLNYKCQQGHTHSITWGNWKADYRCPSCAGNAKLNFEFVKASFEKEEYTLLSKKYINSSTKLNYICPNGHKHNIDWGHWKQGKRCPTCSGNIKLSFNFVKTLFEKEDYTLLSEEYINNKQKLEYVCPKGHKHNISWNDWRNGNRCPACWAIKNSGQGNSSWKGGVNERQIALYNTYSPQISYCEETRRNLNDLDLLQVKCAKCGNFFTPSLKSVCSRIEALNNLNKGEHKFYCSDECKRTCSIFNRKKYSADEKRSKTNPNFTSAELQTWSQEILKRTNYVCEYCGGLAIEAHHILPKKLEPFYALDPDNGIACCKECHYKFGHKDECSTGALANIIC